jgi:glycerol-3-phosphate O-acyltransferase
VLAQAKDPDRDVFLVPVAVSYELIPDLPYFDLLLKGKQLKKKNNPFVKRIMGSLFYFGADLFAYLPLFLNKARKKKFGNVYIDYKAPISVRSIVDVQKNRNENARDDFSAHRFSMQQVSSYLQKEFFCLYRILPVHLVSFLLKRGNDTAGKMETQTEPLIEKLRENNRNTELVSKLEPAEIVKQGLDILLKQNAISIKKEIVIRKQFIIDYYSAAV